jgi:hypothetical protein
MSLHIHRFVDSVKAHEARGQKDFSMPMRDAKDLHADITKLLLTLEQLHEQPPPLDEAMRTWWQNIQDDGGLRLTYEGFYVFENLLELSSYSFELPEKLLTPKNLLAMDRRMTCPYYMVNNRKLNKIIMFGSKEAMMATLHGDMQRFITSLSY